MTDIQDKLPAPVHAFSTFIAHANSSLNPIIYGAYNKQFRKGYLILLNRIFCNKFTKTKKVTKLLEKTDNNIAIKKY